HGCHVARRVARRDVEAAVGLQADQPANGANGSGHRDRTRGTTRIDGPRGDPRESAGISGARRDPGYRLTRGGGRSQDRTEVVADEAADPLEFPLHGAGRVAVLDGPAYRLNADQAAHARKPGAEGIDVASRDGSRRVTECDLAGAVADEATNSVISGD